MFNYPLNLTFKYRVSPQLNVTDSAGSLIIYVKQKLFALKEQITIFADEAQTQQLYRIQADKVMTTTPQFDFTDTEGRSIGAIKHYRLSMWKARFEVLDTGGNVTMNVTENNPGLKALAALLDEIPFVGLFNGYIFRPSYSMTRTDGTHVLKITRQPSMFDRRFIVASSGNMTEEEERRALLSIVLVVLTERSRK